ncbi:rho guanine nucleotide exchange factor 9-like, partial [Frankliniella occidentalis]|uniref:Rho guanine nucleotide exchange factor 9-like n=1 Tax=Frankliniella occidentalis TaxID=133901 RepID=A0A9C6X1E8_FRAOC
CQGRQFFQVRKLFFFFKLTAIFLNAEELQAHATALAERLRDSLEMAVEQGDDDLLSVDIGRLFLAATPMLRAFEHYCTRQAAASLLLASLEKEKELLRIFLRVSQMENAVLRRMNLNSFLMVPVQRVTKYPLLLARLYKVTPCSHPAKELLLQAQHHIELHLEHMNSVAKDISSTKLWRRITITNGRRSGSESDMVNIKLRKMAVEVLEWTQDVSFPMEGRLLFAQPADSSWRRGRAVKMSPVSALLVTQGHPSSDSPMDAPLHFASQPGVRAATLLLLREKGGRYSLLRDPLFLDKCMVCCEVDWDDYFEVQELATKDSFVFKAEDVERTRTWYRQLQVHAQGLGSWRKRRNALANIMINGMQLRS